MKYLAIFEKNVERIFQLQWKIGNIPDMFLQYSVLCGDIDMIHFGLDEITLKVYEKKNFIHFT